MSRLKEEYSKTIRANLKKELGYSSVMMVPRISSIVINMGVGEAATDKKALENAMDNLTQISGQKPVKTLAKKSVAGFKIRAGWPIGTKVTLRGVRMYEFLDRLVNIVLPRVRDFRGLSTKSFDGRGNYNLGIKEQIIFPEIEFEKIDKIRGMDINIVTTAKDDDSAAQLLSAFNFPFKK